MNSKDKINYISKWIRDYAESISNKPKIEICKASGMLNLHHVYRFREWAMNQK